MYYVLIWIEFWKKTLSRQTFMIDIFLDMKYIWLTSDTEPDLQYKGCLEKQALPDLTCLMDLIITMITYNIIILYNNATETLFASAEVWTRILWHSSPALHRSSQMVNPLARASRNALYLTLAHRYAVHFNYGFVSLWKYAWKTDLFQ